MTSSKDFYSSKIEDNSFILCNDALGSNVFPVDSQGGLLGFVGNSTHTLDTYTLCDYETTPYKHKVDKVSKVDSVTTLTLTSTPKRWYYMARDKEELIDLCKFSKYDSSEMQVKHSEKLFCLLSRGMIEPNTFYLFSLLSKQIVRRNVGVFDKDELLKVLKTDSKNFSREVKRLEGSGIMKFTAPLGNKNKLRNIVFHPSLVWKGDYMLRGVLERKVQKRNKSWYEVNVSW